MAILTKLGPQRLLAGSAGLYHDLAKAAALPNGTIAAVTLREYGEATSVYRLQFRDSLTHTLLANKVLNFAATGNNDIPTVTALADGHVLVTWTSAYNPTNGTNVWMQEFDGAGLAVGAAAQVNPIGLSSGLESVTALPDGGVLISWNQFTQSANPTYNNWNVHARLVDAAGNMGNGFLLNSSTNGAEGGSRIAVHADGSFSAIWVKNILSEQRLIYRTFDAHGVPTSSERVLVNGVDSINDTALITMPDGSIMAVWHDVTYPADPAQMTHRLAHFLWLNAAGTSEIFAFSPDTTADVHSAQALHLKDGRIFLSWTEITFDDIGTLATRKAAFLTATGDLSEILTLIPEVATSSPDTTVIELADGRLAVSWSITDAYGTTDTALQYFDPREAAIALLAADTTVRWLGTGFNDTLTGGTAADQISGGNGADRLYGMAGNDLLNGGAGNDRLLGSSGNDSLYGGAGNDLIYGGAGLDHVGGGTGNDTLWGHGGADHFILQPGRGTDSIMDFTEGLDLIDLRTFNFDTVQDALAAFVTGDGGVLFAYGTSQALFVGLSLAALDGTDLLI